MDYCVVLWIPIGFKAGSGSRILGQCGSSPGSGSTVLVTKICKILHMKKNRFFLNKKNCKLFIPCSPFSGWDLAGGCELSEGVKAYACQCQSRNSPGNRSQHPPTQWNRRGGRWSSVEQNNKKEKNATGEAFWPQMRACRTSKHEIYSHFSYFWGHFVRDPNPADQNQRRSMRIRIHNTVCHILSSRVKKRVLFYWKNVELSSPYCSAWPARYK